MKGLKSTLVFLFAFASTASYAQKAFTTGFSGMNVLNPTSHAINSNICCNWMVYVANSFDSTRVYATHWNNDVIYYIDPSTETITDSMAVHVWDIVSDNETDKLFAAQTVNNAVYIINPATKTYDSVTVTEPNMLEKRPGAKEIWITNNKQFSVLDYSGSTPTITSHSITSANTFYRDEVRFNSSGSMALVTNGFENKVYKVNANTKTVVDSITMDKAYGVTFSADDSKFYLSAPLNNKIYTYDANSMALLDSISTTRNPFTIYNNPFANEIWVIDHNQDSLTILDGASMQAIDSQRLHSAPYYVVFHKPGTVGINNLTTGASNAAAYPNPASGILYFTKTVERAELFDITGRASGWCQHCSQIDINGLPAGMYQLRLRNGAMVNNEKIVVQ